MTKLCTVLFILFLVVLSCAQKPDGTLTINISNFAAVDTKSAVVTVLKSFTPVAGSFETLSNPDTILVTSSGSTWTGKGGETYMLSFNIDMVPGIGFTDTGDYQLKGGYSMVTIDGDTTLNLTSSDFESRP